MVHLLPQNPHRSDIGFVKILMGLNSIEENLSFLLQHNSIRLGDVQKRLSFRAVKSKPSCLQLSLY